MTRIRITPENVFQYIGREIVFESRMKLHVRTILRASPSGKTIYINHNDLKGNLTIEKRFIWLKE